MQTTNYNSYETYLAMVVHDLKTPINAQILATEYLLKLGVSENTKELITDVLGSAKYLKTIVDNILTKYQIDINSQNIYIKQNSLNALILDVQNNIKYLLDEKHIDLKIKKQIKKDIQKFDYIEIKRALINLLSNAVDFSRGKIILKITEYKKYIMISVADNGYGINLKNPYDIFNKDLTLSKAQKRLGTGLGLFITKQIITAHNGKIFVKTKSDKGTVISFILPKLL